MTDDPYDRDAKLIPLPAGSKELTREQVEMAADMFGPESSAAKALKRADKHDGPVKYWFSPKEGLLNLELLDDDIATQ